MLQVHTCMCICAQKDRTLSVSFISCLPLLFEAESLSLACILPGSVGYVASKPQGHAGFCFHDTNNGHGPPHSTFSMSSRDPYSGLHACTSVLPAEASPQQRSILRVTIWLKLENSGARNLMSSHICHVWVNNVVQTTWLAVSKYWAKKNGSALERWLLGEHEDQSLHVQNPRKSWFGMTQATRNPSTGKAETGASLYQTS